MQELKKILKGISFQVSYRGLHPIRLKSSENSPLLDFSQPLGWKYREKEGLFEFQNLDRSR